MKILVVTNRYPPYYTGGYELNCQEAVEGLRQAGHQVCVLTSTWGVGKPVVEYEAGKNLGQETSPIKKPLEIHRTLTPCFDFWLKRHNLFFSWFSLWYDQRAAATVLKAFTPDLIYVWNMDWSSIAALYKLQATGKPMIYHFGAPWLCTYSERAAQLRRDFFSRLYRKLEGQEWGWDYRKLRLDAAICMTAFIKRNLLEGGWIKPDSQVIPHGFDLDEWPFQPSAPSSGSTLRLVYVGRLDPLKGIDSLIEALSALKTSFPQLSLTISSAVSDTTQHSSQTYRRKLESRAQELEVITAVNFVQTPREKLADLYAAHHILIFPSIWQEPYGLIPLEAMACGTPVIATGTGGSGEYLRDGENCLLYPPGDVAALVQAVQKLANDTPLQTRLSHNGRKLVEQNFQLKTTLTQIIAYLQSLV